MSAGLLPYLDMLFGAAPASSFAELRWRLRSRGMGREFIALGDCWRLATALLPTFLTSTLGAPAAAS